MSDDETKIVNFQDVHDAKHGPDSEHVYRDVDGSKWFEFGCEFADGDKKYGFTIWAKDHADAERRLCLLRETATVCGKIYTIITG